MPAKCAPLLVIAVAASVLTASTIHAAEPVESLVIVGEHGAAATVVTPDDADTWTLMAAGWLRDYVEKVTGAKLSVVAESKRPAGAVISVGHTRLAEAAGISTDTLKHDGCRMIVKGNVLYLIGRDVAPLHPNYKAVPNPARQPWDYIPIILKGHRTPVKIGAKGTCRAVTRFLEQACGVRWLVPTPKGTVIPKRSRIAVAADLDETFEPWMMYHSNRLLYGDPRSEPAAYANNYRSAVKLYSAGGHTLPRWVPTETYFADHPEYFTLVNGKRTGVGNHLCASNQGVRDIVLKSIQAQFEAGYDLVQLGASDGYVACECSACRQLSNHTGARDADGALALEHRGGPIFDLARWVAEQCLDKYPGRFVHVLIYGPTSSPPKRFKGFPDNVVFEFASSASPELIGAFDGQVKTGGTVYTPWHWTDYGIGIGVKMSYTQAAEMMRYYRNIGIAGIHSGGGQCWGLQGPTYYVFGRMMGDPGLDAEQLLRGYCGGLYGAAADEMVAFFQALHTQSDMGRILDLGLVAMERYPLYYPPERLEALESLLRAAEAAVQGKTAKNWVQMTRDEFDYVRLVANALAIYKDYRTTEDPALITDLRNAVGAFDAYRQRVVNYDGAYAANYFPGHGVLCCVLTQGQGGTTYSSHWGEVRKRITLDNVSGLAIGQSPNCIDKPFTLDLDAEDIEGAFKIAYTGNAPAVDGKLDEAAWQDAPPVFMRGAVQTEIRGLYDDENLYIAYLCEESKDDGPMGVDIKRDNPICFMDVVEFFVDPTSSDASTSYFHFLVGATERAIHDLYEQVPESGGSVQQDNTWNSDGFRYGFNKNIEKKQWSIEMVVPFKDIGAMAPADGDVWLGNHAREGNGLYQWSKGGTPGFCNPKSLNKFRFVRKD